MLRDELARSVEVLTRVVDELGDEQDWTRQDALKALSAVRQARLEVDEWLRRVELHAAREAFLLEARWGDIARAAGVTRQTAQATYRDRENKPRRQPTRATPQHLPQTARQPSERDAQSWPNAYDEDQP